MVMTCCSCTTPAKFLIKDGAHLKPVCNQHKVLYESKGYKILRPLTKEERSIIINKALNNKE